MTLIDKFRLAWNGLNKTEENLFNQAIYNMVGGQTNTYNATLETLLIKGYGENPDVNAIVNQMSSKTTVVPFAIKKIENPKAAKQLRQLHQVTKGDLSFLQKKEAKALEQKAYREDEQKMPLERPNPNQTWTDIMFLFKVYLKVCGNVYLYKVAPTTGANAGEPMQIYILPAHWVQIVLKPQANLMSFENPIDYYILTQGNTYTQFPADTIIHIKRANPFYNQNGSHLYGFSELMAAIRNITSSNNGIDNNVKTMLNSGVYGFIHAGDGASPLTPTQAASLKEALVMMENNPGRLSNIAGASAKMGFTRISLTTEELKPFEYLSFDRKTLCNCLNWPDELMNNDTGGGLNSQKEIQAHKRAITDNIKPDLDLLADSLNKEFVQKFKGYENSVIVFDISGLPEMQTDINTMMDWLNKAPLTPNEIRAEINFDASTEDGTDVIWVPTGRTRIDDPTPNQLTQ